MKKLGVIAGSVFLFQACTVVTLRPAITGIITDSATAMPLQGAVIYSDSGWQEAAVTDVNGRFHIAALQKTRVNIPGEEKDRLSPNANIFIIKKTGYKATVINLDDRQSRKKESGTMLDTIRLITN